MAGKCPLVNEGGQLTGVLLSSPPPSPSVHGCVTIMLEAFLLEITAVGEWLEKAFTLHI